MVVYFNLYEMMGVRLTIGGARPALMDISVLLSHWI